MGAGTDYVESTYHIPKSCNVSYLIYEPPDTLEQLNHSIALPESTNLSPLTQNNTWFLVDVDSFMIITQHIRKYTQTPPLKTAKHDT